MSLSQPRYAIESREVRKPLGLYIHWPFCKSKCPYCDFNSHVRAGIDQGVWRKTLLTELEKTAELLPGTHSLVSIFFGGGTPSLMEPETVAALISRARNLFGAGEIEITLEANPTSVEAGNFRAYRAAGVNRLSMGIQALEDPMLKFLGREHSAAEAIAAIKLAAREFQNYSFDLIYARPGQTVGNWLEELDRAVELAASHLSLYQLTIEQGTAFHTAYGRGDFSLPDSELAADLYEATQERLEAVLPAYEISNHAKPGFECRHNLVYWRSEDYIGIGPGAHGRFTLADGTKIATETHRAPEIWLERVGTLGHGRTKSEPIAAASLLTERLMMGLRLREGIPFTPDLQSFLSKDKLERLVGEGLLSPPGERLSATAAGRQRLNALLAYLTADASL